MKADDLKVGERYNLGAGPHDHWFYERARFVTRRSLKSAEYGGRLKDEIPVFTGAAGGVWVYYFNGGKGKKRERIITATLAKVRPA